MKKTFDTVVISGAGSGIGRALAALYADQTETLILFGRSLEKLNETESICAKKGAKIVSVSIDLADSTRSEDACRNIMMNYSAPDVVIANAGMALGAPKGALHESYMDTKKQMDVNFLGSVALIEACLPKMIEAQKGHIALTSSIAAISALPYCAGYSASKAAMLSYGNSIRAALRKKNIGVSVITPGFVDTEMERRLKGGKPFKMNADNAAKIIKHGIDKGATYIGFPKRLYWASIIGKCLPRSVHDRIMTKWVMRVAP